MTTERRDGNGRRDADDMTTRVEQLEDSSRLMVDALLGSPQLQMDGTRIRLDDGLVAKVTAIEDKLTNGGMKISLPRPAWLAIWAAIISGGAQVVAAVVG